MKARILLLALFFLTDGIAKAATITWANTNGGDWNVATNWSPAQVPVSGDDVIITNASTFVVTNGPSITLSNLTLGGTNGTQTLTMSSLTLTNIGLVNSNGVLNLNGATINGSLMVAQGGVLNLTNNTTYSIFGTLTNNGTVNWSAGGIYGYGPPSYATAVIYNAGLWNSQSDGTFTAASGTPAFFNPGTFRKSGGTGITTIGWTLTSTGTFDVQTGSLATAGWAGNNTLNGNYTGTISVNSNAAVTVATLLPVNWTGGTIAAGGVFNVPAGTVVNWGGGTINGSLTVASGGVLNITNNTTYSIFGALTNNGTVNWSAGSLYGYGPPSFATAVIYNAGLWNVQFDGTFTAASGTPAFINVGTFRKSGGTGITTINWDFTSTGTFDIQTGSLSIPGWGGNNTLNGNFTGTITVNSNATLTVATNATFNLTGGTINGSLIVAPGGVLNLTNNTTYSIFGALTNNGTVNWSAGSIYGYGPPSYTAAVIYNAGLWNSQSDGTLTAASGTPVFLNPGIFRKNGGTGVTTVGWNLTSTGMFDTQTGTLSASSWAGTNTLNGNYAGTITLNSNVSLTVATNAVVNWDSGTINGSMIVAQGGVLNLTNNTTYSIFGTLTNNGTVNWSAGGIYGYGPPSYSTAVIYNAGLWNTPFDGTLTAASGSPAFFNVGTFQKNGGTGITAVNWNFTNSAGILDAQTKTISLAGNYNLTNGTLNVGINSSGNYGIIALSGSPVALTGTVSANLNNGYVPATGTVFPVVTYSSASGVFTNFLPPFAVAMQTNYGGAAFSLTVLNVRPAFAPVTNQFVNELAAFNFTNNVTDPDLGQTLTFALLSGPDGMTINTATGVISWTPTQLQSPSINPVVVRVVDNGTPPLSATNTFNVIVKEVNVAPSLPAISTQTVNELTPLTVTNTATNFNIHSTITGYVLVNPPSGMVISAGGVITWTPAQTQSPGTNFITTIVTNSNPYDLVNPLLTSTSLFTVIVKEVNVAPSLPAISTQTVNELTPLTVTNSATNFNIHSTITGYTLVSPPGGMAISADGIITWTPAQAQSPATNLITTVVTNSNPYDLVNPVLTSTSQFTVVVKEVNVPASLPTIPTQTVNELTQLTVTNSATNSNIHATITGYHLVNPPSNMVISASGVITWTPAQAQSPGTNLITTVVTNSDAFDLANPQLTSTNTFNVIVKEVNVPPSLPTISTQMVNELTPLTVTNTATNANIHSIITGYALLSPPANMVISPGGIISWTPAQTQSPGTNIVTTIVTNSNPYDLVNPTFTSINQFTVIVKEVNVAPILPTISTQTVNELTQLTVTNTAANANIHATITGYTLVNAPSNMVINAAGIITWTPAAAQSPGTNTVTTIVTNNNPYDLVNPQLTATNQFTVIVKEVNVAPTLPVIASRTIYPMTPLTVTNTASGLNVHATLTYSLVSPPTGAAINSAGVITWTPTTAQAPSTNMIATIATSTDLLDAVNPVLRTTNMFTVVVAAPVVVLTSPTRLANGAFEFSFNTATNYSYTILYSTNLTVWSSVVGFVGDGNPVTIYDPNAAGSPKAFYRVQQSP